MLADPRPVLTANKPKAPALTSVNCVHVSWGPVLSLQQFDAPRLGVIQKDMLKFSYKVLRLKKEKFLANSVKSLRTKKVIIFKQAGGGAWQMNTRVRKPRLILSQIQQKIRCRNP